jgi:chondroitin sulfate synthase
MEGSTLGQWLSSLSKDEQDHVSVLLQNANYNVTEDRHGLPVVPIEDDVEGQKASSKTIIKLSSETSTKLKNLYKRVNAKNVGDRSNILIGVTSLRKFFKDRVATVVSTWGNPETLPANIVIRYFVGDLKNQTSSYSSGSVEDIASLAKEAGIVDQSSIIVMTGILDDEYPLVDKASAVIRQLEVIATAKETESPKSKFDWIFDVDDDTYVNLLTLQEFVDKRNSGRDHYLGQRGQGRPADMKMFRNGGLVEPYCMGGTGILFSRKTFRTLALKIDECVNEARLTTMELYDDVLIGICVNRHIGIGCFAGPLYNKRLYFAQNYHNKEDFMDNLLADVLTIHPFKESGTMARKHMKYMAALS